MPYGLNSFETDALLNLTVSVSPPNRCDDALGIYIHIHIPTERDWQGSRVHPRVPPVPGTRPDL